MSSTTYKIDIYDENTKINREIHIGDISFLKETCELLARNSKFDKNIFADLSKDIFTKLQKLISLITVAKKLGKKIHLRFDYNGTLTLSDGTDKIRSEDAISEMFSKNVGGIIDADNWSISDEESRFDGKHITYYKFLEKKYKHLDEKTRKEMVKKLAYAFTNEGNPGACLRSDFEIAVKQHKKRFFDSFLQLMKFIDPDFYESYCERQELKGDERKNATVRVSNVVLTFNTFGIDGPLIEEELGNCYKFTAIREEGKEPLMMYKTMKGVEYFLTMKQYYEILELFDGPAIVQENYKFWDSKGKDSEAGKYEEGQDNTLHFVFDDNLCWFCKGKNVYFKHVNSYLASTQINYYLDVFIEMLQQALQD
jgi:hypothetical protein